MRRLLAGVLIFGVFCCLTRTMYGQSSNASLTGLVTDPFKAAIVGAKITVINESTNVRYEGTTNSSGSYYVTNLPPGSYRIEVERTGFKTVLKPGVVLHVQDTIELNFEMALGSASETLTVTGGAPMVNTQDAAVSTVVDRRFIANLPLNGRSFQSLITLTPGVIVAPSQTNFNGQFSVNGQRPNANVFNVDGVSANFAAFPGGALGAQTGGNLPALTAFGTTQSLVSVDGLEEFKVQTSTYSAEYGRQPGGQISIITRSGTNQFQGSLFDYLRNDALDANDWFANRAGLPKPRERQNDFGGTFGGPIIRDRTFFFLSYEGLRLTLPKFALTNVPSLALRQQAPAAIQPILNAFPVPNGRDLGNGLAELSASYSDPSSLNATSVRIDHTLNSKVMLFGRYNQAPSKSGFRSPNNLNIVNSTQLNTKTLTLGLTASLFSRLSNEMRVNYSDNRGTNASTQGNFGGAVALPRNVLIPSLYDSPSAQGQAILALPGGTSTFMPVVVFFDAFSGSERQYSVAANLAYDAGAHQLKAGVDFRRLTALYDVRSYINSERFVSPQDLLNGSSASGLVQSGLRVKPSYLNLSIYGQDTWRLARRLTLDLGLRWELNPAPSEANGNRPLAVTRIDDLAAMQLAPSGTRLYKTTYNNFAPRIGIAYQLREQPAYAAVFRGGFGVYYDTGNDTSSTGFIRYPFIGSRSLSNVSFPISPSAVAPPPIPIMQTSLATPYPTLEAIDPALKLPYTLQWNIAFAQSLGSNQIFTASYVGAVGRRLVQRRLLNLTNINPAFTFVNLTTNNGTSDYHALQMEFQRRLSRGLQALVSYTWSHAIDEASASFFSTGLPLRGNADFDVRHNFAAAVTYDIPAPGRALLARAILGNWSIDTSIHARSALPVDLIARTFFSPADGTLINVRPDLIAGVPLYVKDPAAPGGRRINGAAFSVPPAGQTGTLGRNVLRGFPAWQVDLALRRQFKLAERLNLQLRTEAFNLFNHPNFGAIQTTLSAANFGQATSMLNQQLGGLNPLYQIGGPRSFQIAAKLLF
jgi:carboxypeptidase family protein/TonB-dependent receptor-like protein